MPNAAESSNLGPLTASALSGAWRREVSRSNLSSENLTAITPLAIATGSGALLWRSVAVSDLQISADLHSAYRTSMLDSAIHEIQVKDIFTRMRSYDIEPILFKGWALARLYPDPGLRPYGDIDLWVRSDQLETANLALPRAEDIYCVELHASFYLQFERSLEQVMSGSEMIPLDQVNVRVPCDEDHLRFICLHFLYHGGWRPLWLCDIAAMVESTSSSFDWDRCFSGSRKHADWIACVIGLAHQLLGADISGTPIEKRAKSLPAWLTHAVLQQWERGPGMSFAENLSFSLPRRLLQPSALIRAFREHWRNPIQGSVELNAWFNEAPRLPIQFGAALRHVPQVAKYFGREIRRA